jgi:UDP-2-acetamido-2-deoxy-ribo-hexuluronate aminotransferase
MTMPFVDLGAQYRRLKDEIDAGIARVLARGDFILGQEVGELEARLAARAGVRHCLGVANGTDALLAVLMAWRIGPGDAVFLPSLTFTATAEVIALLGAEPVFVDVRAHDVTIDPADLEQRIAQVAKAGRLRPRVVIAVDLYGLPADYPVLRAIAERHGLALLADAAQSFGAAQQGRPVGGLAPVTATSFFPAKPLGCYGDGGAVFCDDDALFATLKSIRSHGQGRSKYDIERIGLNSRLDTIQAAVLLAKLTVFDEELAQRDAIARIYDDALDGVVTLPTRIAGTSSTWAHYTIQTSDRDGLQGALREQGIPAVVYYPRPMHLQPAYAGFGDGLGSLPVAESLCERVLSLPSHAYLPLADARRIGAAVRGYFGR